LALIKKYQPETKKILEFGSGSGIHARTLANAGFQVKGIGIEELRNNLGKLKVKLGMIKIIIRYNQP
jgi:2-polyprenyl-3-methyl-5-hydroxy-6-metoxy-1,4-benzoquinol methylase